MTVETAADRAAFIADFGAEVTWTRDSIAQPVFLALFNRPSKMMSGLAEVELLDRAPTIACPEASLPAGAAEDDPVSVVDDFGTHSLRCKLIRPDGMGFVIVDLKA